jgi:hypothetical protein
LAAGWPGAVVGGLLVAGVTAESVPLEEALRGEATRRGLQLLSLRRDAPLSMTLLVWHPPHHGWTMRVTVARTDELLRKGPAAWDDALYDEAVRCLNERFPQVRPADAR